MRKDFKEFNLNFLQATKLGTRKRDDFSGSRAEPVGQDKATFDGFSVIIYNPLQRNSTFCHFPL